MDDHMIVLFIIALIIAIASWSMGWQSRDRQARREAEQGQRKVD
jgi:type II secretory pathway pseudopilin PulG